MQRTLVEFTNGFPPPLCDTMTLLLPVRSFTVSAGEFPAVSQAVMEHAGRNDCAAAGKRSCCPSEVLGVCTHVLLPTWAADVLDCWTLHSALKMTAGKENFSTG